MIHQILHHRWIRLIACLAAQFATAASLNLFIVPLGLYSGGLMGLCQLIRTLLQTYLSFTVTSYDIAGVLDVLINIPILLAANRMLGRAFVGKTLVCILSYTLFYSLIPIPSAPIVSDRLTACLLGGILSGLGYGITLTCGGSSGGLDIIGLCLSKRGSSFTVGRFSLSFNLFLYLFFLLLFDPEVTIYSVIFNFFSSMVIDRYHQQNINVQALIFTRADEEVVAQHIIDHIGRGVTWWNGVGAYTGEHIHVLCVCVSKFEVEELQRAVHAMDPNAFITVQEGVQIRGNFFRKL